MKSNRRTRSIYSVHISQLGISLFRGAYHLHGIEAKLKKQEQVFFEGGLVDVSVAWRDIFQGRMTTDIVLENARVMLTPQILDAFKKAPKKAEEDSKKAASKLFPVRVERIDIHNSSFQFADLVSIPEAARWRMTKIDGRASNLTPSAENPLTLVSLKGALFDKAFVRLAAQVNQISKPLAWKADVELKDFNLPDANGWLIQKLPLTFSAGKLDLFSEVKSENDKIEGYVKPFFKKAVVIAQQQHFISLKHFGIELSTAAINLILRDSATHTLATKALFSYENGEFKLNSAKAISDAIKNGFSEKIPEGIDDEISLTRDNQKKFTRSQGDKP